MTDFRRLDPARRQAGPLQLDLVEAYVGGRVSRREFFRRGTALGLSLGTLGIIATACGDANETGTTAATGGNTGAGGTTAEGATTTAGAAKTGGTIRVASIAPAGPLDPVAMIDLGSYGVVNQSFEYLVYSRGNLELTPGLAESWEPNEDGSEWTFKLRQGVPWQGGGELTPDDVIATMERLVKAGNSALKGIIEAGSVTSPDPTTVVFRLTGPNGNLPYLVSNDNSQAPITPKDYAAGTTLDKQPNGTGPWKLTKYDAKTGATFVRNDDWWGGQTPLDGQEWTFFGDLQPQVVAMQQGQVDVVVQFSVLGGEGLLNDANVNVVTLKSAAHRQIWMRTDKGQFADKRVRQALGHTLDREAMVQALFQGKADIGNDNVIAPVYPYADPSVPQRPKDIAKAKELLQAAGASNITATLHAVKLQEIPDLAVLVKGGAQEAGVTLNVSVEDGSTFYGQAWCPAKPADPPCSGADEIGIVDYGHRGTPDVYLNAALKTAGVWNSSQYQSQEFDEAFRAYQAAVGVDAQTTAAKRLQEIQLEDSPILVPFFYNYLLAHSKKFQGVETTALGQLFVEKASQV